MARGAMREPSKSGWTRAPLGQPPPRWTRTSRGPLRSTSWPNPRSWLASTPKKGLKAFAATNPTVSSALDNDARRFCAAVHPALFKSVPDAFVSLAGAQSREGGCVASSHGDAAQLERVGMTRGRASSAACTEMEASGRGRCVWEWRPHEPLSLSLSRPPRQRRVLVHRDLRDVQRVVLVVAGEELPLVVYFLVPPCPSLKLCSRFPAARPHLRASGDSAPPSHGPKPSGAVGVAPGLWRIGRPRARRGELLRGASRLAPASPSCARGR